MECVDTINNVNLVSFTITYNNISSPSGNWQDFNSLYKKYIMMQRLASLNLIDQDCVVEPNFSDYPNY